MPLSRSLYLTAAAIIAGCSGCTQFPELDQAIDPAVFQAPYPSLLPFDTLQASTTMVASVDPTAALAVRAAALRVRAAKLNALP